MTDACQAPAMTAPGIIARQSALKDGETLKIPLYERAKGCRGILGAGLTRLLGGSYTALCASVR